MADLLMVPILNIYRRYHGTRSEESGGGRGVGDGEVDPEAADR